MNSIDHQYVCVLGYGWSGSSAVVDLLKEFEGNWDPEVEFRILKDPHGVMDLEHTLVDQWDALNVDIALKDFLDFASFMNENEGKFKRGLSYAKSFNGKFMDKTVEFVNDIVNYEFKGFWWIFHYRENYIKWLIKKIINKFIRQKYEKTMFFSNLTREEFYQAVRKYVNSLIEVVSSDQKYRNIVLDQAVPVQHAGKAFDYLDNAKVIIVDRDPRDIYCDLVELEKLVGRDIAQTHDVSKYVKWHKKYRENDHIQDDRILRIRFEDLVLHYEDTVKQIIDFIGDVEMKHITPLKHFDPAVSKKNIGKYKNFPYQDEIRILEEELREYLYPLDE